MLFRQLYSTICKLANIQIFNVTLANLSVNKIYYTCKYFFIIRLSISLLIIIVFNTFNITYSEDFVPVVLDDVDIVFAKEYSEYDASFLGQDTIEYEVYDIFIPKERIIYQTTETISTSSANSTASDTSDTSSSSTSNLYDKKPIISNQTPEAHLREPDLILKEFYTKVFYSDSNENGIKVSLDYVKQSIPANLWAQTMYEVNDPQHPIHKYMEHISTTCTLITPAQKAAFLQYHAAVTTYNIMILSPKVPFEIIEKIFYYNVDQVREKYNVHLK